MCTYTGLIWLECWVGSWFSYIVSTVTDHLAKLKNHPRSDASVELVDCNPQRLTIDPQLRDVPVGGFCQY